jgi:hypothetical protein
MAVATLQTFANLNQQSSFVDTKSITFAYNQTKPTYVISELERAKLISPLEAQAARTAFSASNLKRVRSQRQSERHDSILENGRIGSLPPPARRNRIIIAPASNLLAGLFSMLLSHPGSVPARLRRLVLERSALVCRL